jgi:uridine kinase
VAALTESDWLAEKLAAADRSARSAGASWTAKLGSGASPGSIADLERELGSRLPESHRRFLSAHDGARFSIDVVRPIEWSYDVSILSTESVLAATMESRELLADAFGSEDPYAQQAMSLIVFAAYGAGGDRCMLNPNIIDDTGEYAVVDAFNEALGEWLTSVVAGSFGEWLDKMFEAVITRQQLLHYWLPTAIAASIDRTDKPQPPSELLAARDTIVAAIRRLTDGRDMPVVVALDGGSGSGKSTLAAMIANELCAALVQSDDFFAAAITDTEWDARTPAEKARDAIDWRRVRADALEPLRAGKPARWHAFDFDADVRPDGTYAMCTDFVEREPNAVIVLDGAYSTRPELADLIDLSVLVDVPVAVRHARLAAREEKSWLAAWHARWDDAEAYYFSHVRPASSFDLVVTTARRG